MSFNAVITRFYLGSSFLTDGDFRYSYSVESDELSFTGEMYCDGEDWFTRPLLFSYYIYPIEKLVISVDVYKSLGKNDVYMHLKDYAYDKFKNNVSKFIKENLGDINKFIEPFLVSKEKYKEEKQKFTSNNPRKDILKYVYFKKMQKEIGSKYVETTHMNFESIINKPITID